MQQPPSIAAVASDSGSQEMHYWPGNNFMPTHPSMVPAFQPQTILCLQCNASQTQLTDGYCDTCWQAWDGRRQNYSPDLANFAPTEPTQYGDQHSAQYGDQHSEQYGNQQYGAQYGAHNVTTPLLHVAAAHAPSASTKPTKPVHRPRATVEIVCNSCEHSLPSGNYSNSQLAKESSKFIACIQASQASEKARLAAVPEGPPRECSKCQCQRQPKSFPFEEMPSFCETCIARTNQLIFDLLLPRTGATRESAIGARLKKRLQVDDAVVYQSAAEQGLVWTEGSDWGDRGFRTAKPKKKGCTACKQSKSSSGTKNFTFALFPLICNKCVLRDTKLQEDIVKDALAPDCVGDSCICSGLRSEERL